MYFLFIILIIFENFTFHTILVLSLSIIKLINNENKEVTYQKLQGF